MDTRTCGTGSCGHRLYLSDRQAGHGVSASYRGRYAGGPTARLEGFIDNQAATGVHIGQVKRSLEACSPGNDATLFEEDSDAQSLLHIWCQKKNLAKIAQIWVRGVSVDWKLLYDV